jgi:hypothetical protein
MSSFFLPFGTSKNKYPLFKSGSTYFFVFVCSTIKACLLLIKFRLFKEDCHTWFFFLNIRILEPMTGNIYSHGENDSRFFCTAILL